MMLAEGIVMEKRKLVFTTIVSIIIVGVISIWGISSNSNKLSSKDTFDTFIRLVEDGKYEEAKKYTTSNFTNNLSNIKDLKISKMNKDYKLSKENKYVYKQTTKLLDFIMEDIYIFELKETFTGWKIDKFKRDMKDNGDELYNYNLVY